MNQLKLQSPTKSAQSVIPPPISSPSASLHINSNQANSNLLATSILSPTQQNQFFGTMPNVQQQQQQPQFFQTNNNQFNAFQ